jgi:hypothetical protein
MTGFMKKYSIVLVIVLMPLHLFAAEIARNEKAFTITWNDSPGIERYDIVVKDAAEAIVLSSAVTRPEVPISLPAGTYFIQITAINKFGKVATQSAWQRFEVKAAPEKKSWPLAQDLVDLGLKIGAGYYYTMPLGQWQNYYENSYIGAMLRLSLTFGKLGALKKYPFFRHFGVDIDSSFTQFYGKNVPNKLPFNSKNILAGANVFFTTGKSIPINLIIRFGCGASFTRFEYQIKTPKGDDLNLWSTDPYVLAGLSVEFNPYKSFFSNSVRNFCSLIIWAMIACRCGIF